MPFETSNLLKSCTDTNPQILHLISFKSSFGMHILQIEWPQLANGMGSITKCSSSDVAHFSSS